MSELINRMIALHQTRDRGATAVEYGLIVAAIAAVIVAVVVLLGTEIQGAFQTVLDSISGTGDGA